MSEGIQQPIPLTNRETLRQHVVGSAVASFVASEDELRLLAALRAGDEDAFIALVNRYHVPMLRLARIYVGSHAVAEEVVQETWLGVLQGLSRFEARSSLKVWLFRILTNCAKTRGQREGRSIPFSSLSDFDADAEPAVDPERFFPADQQQAGRWISVPRNWGDNPEKNLLSQETRSYIQQAIAVLPPNQREVITLRDVEGWSADEVCHLLDLTEANQRVLLHRARSKVRRALEQYFDEKM